MKAKEDLLVLGGALTGGILGYLACIWCARHGYAAMALPGGLVGLGAGIFHGRTLVPSLITGIFGLALGIFTEWHLFPFVADESFTYFVLHLHDLPTITLVMIGVGAAIVFWVPFRRLKDGQPLSK